MKKQEITLLERVIRSKDRRLLRLNKELDLYKLLSLFLALATMILTINLIIGR